MIQALVVRHSDRKRASATCSQAPKVVRQTGREANRKRGSPVCLQTRFRGTRKQCRAHPLWSHDQGLKARVCERSRAADHAQVAPQKSRRRKRSAVCKGAVLEGKTPQPEIRRTRSFTLRKPSKSRRRRRAQGGAATAYTVRLLSTQIVSKSGESTCICRSLLGCGPELLL